ncbi:hypothetical protein KY290_025028 [Solanum tuberosum]|uniref:Uncharacterized protein n=1 Tax=Solanum tuberosum TaxID=4113 RepID=A0ABQ7USH2_SOLTU|nr:hypothetical protein KY284_023881 [Solanum tuberosum]KAH0754758.1 hypothetical protein KY290_025028 [Solanum tuberosum]
MVQIKPPKPSYSKEKTLNPNILLYSLLSTLAAASQLSSPSFRRKLPPLAGGSCFSLPLFVAPLSFLSPLFFDKVGSIGETSSSGSSQATAFSPSWLRQAAATSSSGEQQPAAASNSSEQQPAAPASSSSNQPPGETTTSSSSSQ